MSRLSSISDSSGTLSAYKYLGAGTIVEEDYADVDVKLSYLDLNGNVTGLDRFGRVADQVWERYGANPAVLDDFSYTYDRAGNRTARDNELHSAFDEDYVYDALDRLTSATRADNFDQSWGLDGLGNFGSFNDDGTQQTRTVNAANEITSITTNPSWATPVYDLAGNMISGPKSGDETTRVHYVYDAWNRLVAVKADNGGQPGNLIARYEYDGANRRVEKVLADQSGADYFYNQDWQLLEERQFNSQSQPVESHIYLWSPRYIDAPVLRDTYDSQGALDEDARVYYTGDANFNVTALLDSDGAVLERYVYSAYGETTVYSAAWTNPAAPATDGPLYAGYMFDAETGNYLARNRYYTVAVATWMSRDPIGYGGGDPNLYRYVLNDPLDSNDPMGKCPCSEEDCTWTGYLSVSFWGALLGPAAQVEFFGVGTDSTGCKYEATANGSLVDGVTAFYGMGYWSITSSFSGLSAPCRWPVSTGSPVRVVVAELLGDVGPLGLTYSKSEVGMLVWGAPFSVGGINMGFGGGTKGRLPKVTYTVTAPAGFEPPDA